MDYKIPKCLQEPHHQPEGKEKNWYGLFEQYLKEGLEDISTESLNWDPESREEFIRDLEYCINHHVNYYDLHPEYRETEDSFY